jgi:DNA/RNA endonuclease YhcR with UshA esterase domain
MKTIFVLILSLIFQTSLFAQSDTIKAENAKDYISKTVVLKGKLMGVKEHVDRKGDTIAFLDIDQAFPNTQISVTVFKSALETLKISKSDIGKTVLISGEIVIYREKPSLTVSDASKFKFVE